jgi:hypothetical protein
MFELFLPQSVFAFRKSSKSALDVYRFGVLDYKSRIILGGPETVSTLKYGLRRYEFVALEQGKLEPMSRSFLELPDSEKLYIQLTELPAIARLSLSPIVVPVQRNLT